MINQRPFSKALHITLWAAQVLLAAAFIWTACMKLLQPVETLSRMWPWAGQVPAAVVKFTGIADLLGAIGLIMPSLLHIQPKLTPIAALGIVFLMVCASIFHIVRGETSVIGLNIFFAIVAAFISWGRFKKAPITSK